MLVPSSPLSSPAQSSQGELSHAAAAPLSGAAPPRSSPPLVLVEVESNSPLADLNAASGPSSSAVSVPPADACDIAGCPLLSWHQDPQEFDYLPFADLQPIETAAEAFGAVALKEEPEMVEVEPSNAASTAAGTDDETRSTSAVADGGDSCDDSCDNADVSLDPPPQLPSSVKLEVKPEELELSASTHGTDTEEEATVSATMARLLREARANAQAAKLSLRNSLKADLRAKHGALSATERGKLRSRREAAVSRQNKVEYANQLETMLQRLVRENHRLRRAKPNAACGCAGSLGASAVVFKAK